MSRAINKKRRSGHAGATDAWRSDDDVSPAVDDHRSAVIAEPQPPVLGFSRSGGSVFSSVAHQGAESESSATQFRGHGGSSGQHSSVSARSVLSHQAGLARFFKRAPGGDAHDACKPFDDCVVQLLSLREAPPGRPDLASRIPDDDTVQLFISKVRRDVASSEFASKAGAALQLVTPDEALALAAYTAESPFPLGKWLNAWLLSNRRDDQFAKHVGPFFALLYRAMEKLPRSRVSATCSLSLKQNPELRDIYENYSNKCAKGAPLSLGGIASFSVRDDDSGRGGRSDEAAVVYACGSLEGVNLSPFSLSPAKDGEVVPLPPAQFVVQSAVMLGQKLIVGVEHVADDGSSYVVPRRRNSGLGADGASRSRVPAADKRVDELSADELISLLQSKHVNQGVLQAIEEKQYAGVEFIDPEFIDEAFNDAVKEKFQIGKLQLNALIRVRNALLGHESAPAAGAPAVPKWLAQLSLPQNVVAQENWFALQSIPAEAAAVLVQVARPSDAQMAKLLDPVAASLALLLVQVTPRTPQSVELWSRMVGRVAASDAGKSALGTAAVRDALVAAASHAKTPAATAAWAQCIATIAANDSNQRLFGVPAVRDAVVSVAQHATNDDAVRWWAGAVCGITTNDGSKAAFATDAVRAAIAATARYATNSDAALLHSVVKDRLKPPQAAAQRRESPKRAEAQPAAPRRESPKRVDAPPAAPERESPNRAEVSRAEPLQSAPAAVAREAPGAQSDNAAPAAKVAAGDSSLPKWLAELNMSQQVIEQENWPALQVIAPDVAALLVQVPPLAEAHDRVLEPLTAQIVQALLQVSPRMPQSVEVWTRALSRVAVTEAGRAAVGTAAVRDKLVEIGQNITTADALRCWAGAVRNITATDNNKLLFGTAAVRDVLVSAGRSATTAEAVRWWANAISNIAANNNNRALVGTPAVRDALVTAAQYATTANAVHWWASAVANATAGNEANKALFGTPAVRDALVDVAYNANTAEAVRWWACAVSYISVIDRNLPLFTTDAVRAAVKATQTYATTPESAKWHGVAKDRLKEPLFGCG
jgi:hypothetical protein